MKNLVSNYFYSILYQMLILLAPIITTPYVSRVLKPEGVGVNDYIISIVQMFSLFIIFSFPTYGSKQIARKKGKLETSQEFWSIYFIQAIISILVILSYLFFAISYKEYMLLFIINLFHLLAYAFDISWFFIGREEIKKVILRNTLVKITGIVLILTIVKDENDLKIYMLINALTLFIGQLIMWVPLLKVIVFKKISLSSMKVHFLSLTTLFIPQIMIQVYGSINKIVLGVVSGEVQVGFYNQSYKIIKVCLGIITALSQVMLPRMSKVFALGKEKEFQNYVNTVIQFILLITIPMSFGLAAIAPNFVSWFFGEEFLPVTNLLILMSPVIIFVGLANVFGIQILIAADQQNKYTISVTIGAVLSVIANVLFVRPFGSMGSTIALLIAEISGVLVQLFYVRKYIQLKLFLSHLFKYLLLGTSVYLSAFIVGKTLSLPAFPLSFVQILVGILIYLIGLLVTKDSLIKKIIEILRS